MKTKQYSISEYADKIGKTRSGVHWKIKMGQIKAKKIGKYYVIEIEETEEK
jgi:hypothetical protein